MKLIVCCIFLSLTGCSSFLNKGTRSVSSESLSALQRIPLDVHFHYWPNIDGFLGARPDCELSSEEIKERQELIEKYGEDFVSSRSECQEDYSYQDFLKSDLVTKAGLISPSFSIENGSKNQKKSEKNNLYTLQNISAFDKKISDLTLQNPGRFYGYCGYNYSWPVDLAKNKLKKCLNLPGMKGIKIHVSDAVSLAKQETWVQIQEVLKSVRQLKPIVLWHLGVVETRSIEKANVKVKEAAKILNARVVEWFFYTVQTNPSLNFIIGHAFHLVDGMKKVNELERSSKTKLKNLWVELSTIEFRMTKEDMLEMKSQLDQFGLDRILLGSDNYYHEKAPQAFYEAFSFTPLERNQILIQNGERFLKLLEQ